MTESNEQINLDLTDPVNFQIGMLNQFPHEKQKEVLRSNKKHKLVVCGRRSGKTQMLAGEIIRGAMLKLYPRQIVIAPIYKQAMIVYHKIIELMGRKVETYIEQLVKSPQPKIIFRNKSIVDFGSADNPNSLRGEAYDRVLKDESAFIKEDANKVIRPLTFDTGAPEWDTTTPFGKGELWERWNRGISGRDPDIGCFHYNYKDNPYLNKEGIREIEKDIEEYGEDHIYVQTEIYGNFVEDVNSYFPQNLILSCVDEYAVINQGEIY